MRINYSDEGKDWPVEYTIPLAASPSHDFPSRRIDTRASNNRGLRYNLCGWRRGRGRIECDDDIGRERTANHATGLSSLPEVIADLL